jgi:hypothetical protein
MQIKFGGPKGDRTPKHAIIIFMNDLQEVFNRIRETRTKSKEIRKMYQDSLIANQEYQEVKEKLEELKIRKKQIEAQIQEDQTADFQKLDAYKMHVKNDLEMLSDLALNKLVSGETVEVVDEAGSKYEPLFTVKFKKA